VISSLHPWRKKYGRTSSHQVLALGAVAGWRCVYLRNLHAYTGLAVRLVVAYGPPHSALSANDSGRVRDAGGLSVVCQPETASKLEPDLVHGVVERSTRCSDGGAGSRQPRAHRAPVGRCPGVIGGGCGPGVFNAPRRGSRSLLVDDKTVLRSPQHCLNLRAGRRGFPDSEMVMHVDKEKL